MEIEHLREKESDTYQAEEEILREVFSNYGDYGFFGNLLRRQAAAGPGVDHLAVLPVGGRCGVKLRPGAEAGVYQPHPLQFFQSRLVNRRPLTLVIGAGASLFSGADVPVQAQPPEVRFHLRRVPPGTPGAPMAKMPSRAQKRSMVPMLGSLP